MPSLSRWFNTEYRRLDAEGKGPLVEAFDAFRRAYFAQDVPAVFAAIPTLRRLADSLEEPTWRLVTDYYAAFATSYWQGNLTAGLGLITGTLVQATAMLGAGSVLELFLREALLGAWLCTDSRGYAPAVRAAVDELPLDSLPRDLALRFELCDADALAYAEPDRAQECLERVLATLPELDWPQGYRLRARAQALERAGRLAEALDDLRAAERAFESIRHRIEANDARLRAAEILRVLGDHAEAQRAFGEALSAAEHSPNRAQVGMAQGGVGKTLLAQGRPDQAAEWLDRGVRTLDGLGWLRAEAELALELARAGWAAGLDARTAFTLDAGRRIGELRSTDLRPSLAALTGDQEAAA